MTLLNEASTILINELIEGGWEFILSYGVSVHQQNSPPTWEADFTRKREDGRWDIYESGYSSDDPNEAIHLAYQNVMDGLQIDLRVQRFQTPQDMSTVDSRYKSEQDRIDDSTQLMEARLERLKKLTLRQVIRARMLQCKLRLESLFKKWFSR